jgi:hypothetical protein
VKKCIVCLPRPRVLQRQLCNVLDIANMAVTAVVQPHTLSRWSSSRIAHAPELDRSNCCQHASNSSFHGAKLRTGPLSSRRNQFKQCRSEVRAAANDRKSAPGGKKTRIHQLVEEKGVLLMPGCYDALSAKILQKSGFNAGKQHREYVTTLITGNAESLECGIGATAGRTLRCNDSLPP